MQSIINGTNANRSTDRESRVYLRSLGSVKYCAANRPTRSIILKRKKHASGRKYLPVNPSCTGSTRTTTGGKSASVTQKTEKIVNASGQTWIKMKENVSLIGKYSKLRQITLIIWRKKQKSL